ncbi:hypothetical protein R3P38DRAFT_1454169 [Favolaschia claudopus]|uniref:Uncharacterized protein n=1 Tax=Favolaschia claudopus TaxID=2862362 RepID=A0AAW0AM14_9AGAR
MGFPFRVSGLSTLALSAMPCSAVKKSLELKQNKYAHLAPTAIIFLQISISNTVNESDTSNHRYLQIFRDLRNTRSLPGSTLTRIRESCANLSPNLLPENCSVQRPFESRPAPTFITVPTASSEIIKGARSP